ncbi:MAG: TonB-dependent siderophore receptor [Pseudomonas sp.]
MGASVAPLPLTAIAAEQSATQTYNIPAQALDSALTQFADQAGLRILFSSSDVAGLRSAGLQGNFAVKEALAKLLQGSGYSVQFVDEKTFTLRKVASGSAELDAATINGNLLGASEGTGAYTVGTARAATKLPLSLRETPQSVSVLTRQLMDDQQLSTLNDVLKFTPGISTNHRDSDRYTFYSRGFTIQNYQFDGLPSPVINDSQQYTGTLLDMAIYDRVEVIRGANGLMSGAGNPSATVNLVRKRPTEQFQSYVSGEAGAWDKYRSEGDVSGPLNDSGTVRGRLVAAYEKQNSFTDWYKQEKKVMYGALDIDLSDSTVLRTSLDYQNNDSDGVTFGDIPLYNSNGSQTNFSRSFNPGARWSYLDNSHYNFTTALEHQLGNDWSLKAAYSHQYSYRRGTVGSASGGTVNQATGGGVFAFVNRLDSYQTQDTADIYASGPFQLLGREHELVVGASTSRSHLNYPTYQNQNPAIDNIYEWNGDQFARPHLSKTQDNLSRLRQTATYGALRLKPADDLSVILGARVSWWKEMDETLDPSPDPANSPSDTTKKSGVVTPYAGIIYDLNDTYSLYASYTSIFQPQASTNDANNKSLDPLEGDNYEVGIKGEFFGGALNASIALFEVQQDNLALEVGWDDVRGQSIYQAISGTVSRGVESEIAGELAPGWNVFGGYTYRESKDRDDKRIQADQPMNLFKLGTTYRLQGELNRLTVGGNVTWQSEIYKLAQLADDNYYKAKQSDYALVGLLANYDVDEHLTVGLNLNNLFDEKYYDGLGTFNAGSYGEPRNVMVNAKWQF